MSDLWCWKGKLVNGFLPTSTNVLYSWEKTMTLTSVNDVGVGSICFLESSFPLSPQPRYPWLQGRIPDNVGGVLLDALAENGDVVN